MHKSLDMFPADFDGVPAAGDALAWSDQVTVLAGMAAGATLAALAVYLGLYFAASSTQWKYDDDVVLACKWPLLFLFPTMAVRVAWPYTTLFVNDDVNTAVQRSLTVAVIIAVFWLTLNAIAVGFKFLEMNSKTDISRLAATRIAVLKRLVYFAATFVMFGSLLFSFPGAWQVGVSMLASAGATGLFLGLAAKPGLENIISSLIIAFSQPITLDDEVVVDGNNGIIEKIGSQYVVVKTEDGRRLIHPLSDFTNKSFENWTKIVHKKRLPKVGYVTLYFDIAVLECLADLREHMTTFLNKPPARAKWDEQVSDVSVEDSDKNGVVCLSFSASASNGPDLRALVSAVREEMLCYVLQRYPHVLLRNKIEAAASRGGEPTRVRANATLLET